MIVAPKAYKMVKKHRNPYNSYGKTTWREIPGAALINDFHFK